MNRYFVLSCILHLTLAMAVVLVMDSAQKEQKTTYTIDFIGSGKVVAMQNQAVAAQTETPAPATSPEPPKEEPKPAKKAENKKAPKSYDSKSEIAAEKQKKKKQTPKQEPLAAPSVLDDKETPAKEAAASSPMDGEGEFEGGNIQTDFATFPYPWYITQVRNSLWSEWEKRRPVGVTLKTVISFAIARDGKIKNLNIETSSKDDSFDFSAKSAVINAGPFPPLPMLYEKDELTVTVEFKQEK